MEMEHYVFLVLMFLVSTLINVTVAGWLALQMGRFIWMNLLNDPRFTSKSKDGGTNMADDTAAEGGKEKQPA